MRIFFYVFLMTLISLSTALSQPEIFQLSPDTQTEALTGGASYGSAGDILMCNEAIVVVIQGDPSSPSVGMVTHLALRSQPQRRFEGLIPAPRLPLLFRSMDIQSATESNQASVVFLYEMKPRVLVEQRYILQDMWQGIWIVTQIQNQSEESIAVPTLDEATGAVCVEEVRILGDRNAGFAYGWLEREGMSAPVERIPVPAGQSVRFSRFLAVGEYPARAWEIVKELQYPMMGYVAGRVFDTDFKPVATAELVVEMEDGELIHYPGANGVFQFKLPDHPYSVEIYDEGREPDWEVVIVKAGETYGFDSVMDPPSGLRLNIRNIQGESIPAVAKLLESSSADWPWRKNKVYRLSEDTVIMLTPGSYRISLAAPGYQGKEIDVEMGVSEGKTIETILEKPPR